MKITELRIGNYIGGGLEYDTDPDFPLGFWHKVRSIGNDEQEFEQIECETEESFEWIFKDNWCGIPLTEEWLKAFGARLNRTDDNYEIDIRNYLEKETWLSIEEPFLTSSSIMELEVNIVFLDKRKNSDKKEKFIYLNHITYVHQLQNLYFALTGEELTLKK